MILLRRGVNDDFHPLMRPVFPAADKIFNEVAGRDPILTSGRDREHGLASLHYYGLAADWQTKDLTEQIALEVYRRLKDALLDFDVFYEGTHIHTELGDRVLFAAGLDIRAFPIDE